MQNKYIKTCLELFSENVCNAKCTYISDNVCNVYVMFELIIYLFEFIIFLMLLEHFFIFYA